jgi:hypothetical protein
MARHVEFGPTTDDDAIGGCLSPLAALTRSLKRPPSRDPPSRPRHPSPIPQHQASLGRRIQQFIAALQLPEDTLRACSSTPRFPNIPHLHVVYLPTRAVRIAQEAQTRRPPSPTTGTNVYPRIYGSPENGRETAVTSLIIAEVYGFPLRREVPRCMKEHP